MAQTSGYTTIPISGGGSIRVDRRGKQASDYKTTISVGGRSIRVDKTGNEFGKNNHYTGKITPKITTPRVVVSPGKGKPKKSHSTSSSGKKKAILKEKDFITMINRFHDELEVIYKNIKVLSVSYRALMTGDADGPYWNGAPALSFYKTARGNLQNAVTAYQETMQAYKKLVTRYDNILRKGYWK